MSRMRNVKEKKSLILQVVIIFIWGAALIDSDAYYVNYLVLLMITAVCIYINAETEESLSSRDGSRIDVIINLSALLFSCMIAFSNYRLWDFADIPEGFGAVFSGCCMFLTLGLFLIGGFFAFRNVFTAFFRRINMFLWNPCDADITPQRAFAMCFVLLVLTRTVVLFLCQYPGDLSPDSLDQMRQLLSDYYSNHHPFYHTMVIKCCVTIGLRLFGDINAAVAMYCFFQILFSAMCFSFAVSTMVRMRAPRWIVRVCAGFFVCMPYHIIYAITVWKDVMFSCFILLFVTFMIRCMLNMGNMVVNHAILAVSGLGTCLFRSNGFFVFFFLTLAYVILWKVKNKRILFIFCSCIVIGFVLKHAVLAKLNVRQPDLIESLAVPAQQIARVVREGCELSGREREILSKVVDIDRVPETYMPGCADPIKSLVRETGDQRVLADENADYIKLYAGLGMKHPWVYMKAWIDETRGYWNAGYEYWRWQLEIWENEMGIKRTTRSPLLDTILREYLWLFSGVQAFRIFLSIGLFVWIDLLMLMVALYRKDRMGIFISLPVLIIVASLLLATPIFSEFRYIYAAFCTLPLVIVFVLRPMDRDDRMVIAQKEG